MAEFPSQPRRKGAGRDWEEAETRIAALFIISYYRGCSAEWASAGTIPGLSSGPQNLGGEQSSRVHSCDPLAHTVRTGMMGTVNQSQTELLRVPVPSSVLVHRKLS